MATWLGTASENQAGHYQLTPPTPTSMRGDAETSILVIITTNFSLPPSFLWSPPSFFCQYFISLSFIFNCFKYYLSNHFTLHLHITSFSYMTTIPSKPAHPPVCANLVLVLFIFSQSIIIWWFVNIIIILTWSWIICVILQSKSCSSPLECIYLFSWYWNLQ